MDPVPDPVFVRKSGRAGNRTRTSRSVSVNLEVQVVAMLVVLTGYSKTYKAGVASTGMLRTARFVKIHLFVRTVLWRAAYMT
jgi:hypothetical protein